MKSERTIMTPQELKIQQMDKLSTAYLEAQKNNLIQTTWITLPPLSVMLEKHQQQLAAMNHLMK